jgi:hypothetical protein
MPQRSDYYRRPPKPPNGPKGPRNKADLAIWCCGYMLSYISTSPYAFVAWCIVKHKGNFSFTMVTSSLNIDVGEGTSNLTHEERNLGTDAPEYKAKALTNPSSTFGICIELWRATCGSRLFPKFPVELLVIKILHRINYVLKPRCDTSPNYSCLSDPRKKKKVAHHW